MLTLALCLESQRADTPLQMSVDSKNLFTDRPEVTSFYEPLRDRVFRLFWSAAIVSITVVWMHEMGTAWFMRELTGADPLMVSLIQAASSLPVMLLSLPMGTLGDLWGRRRFLLATHCWLIGNMLVFWAVTVNGSMTPSLLVFLTALLGVGKAMLMPGLAAVIPELVSRRALPLGIGLYSMANNGARVVGPALAGLLLLVAGIAVVYASTIVLLFISLLLLLGWRRPEQSVSPAGGYVAELRAGLVYCVGEKQFRTVIGRVFVFFICAAAVHALLPVIVGNPALFGISWGAYGIGAVSGAVLFPYFSRSLSLQRQLSLGVLTHAIGLGLLALTSDDFVRLPVMLFMGMCWFGVMSTAQVGVQAILPGALRARGMGVFTMVVMAGVGLGAPLWGFVAKVSTPMTAILSAMVLSLLALAATYRLGRPSKGP